MRNRKLKAILAAVALGTCIVSFTGCGMLEMLGIETTKKEKDEKIEKHEEKKISVAPTISKDLGGEVVWGKGQQAEALVVEANPGEGGTLSYQWYRNNSDSNGGGTPIEGATESKYVPDTSELGETFYYVVVANQTSEDEIPGMATSSTVSVKVQEEKVLTEAEKQDQAQKAEEAKKADEAKYAGTWQQDAKGWWFKRADGSFAKSEWIKDKDRWFVFDKDGYMIKGWYQEGDDWYYLGRDGHMIVDFEVEGYHLGPDGKMIK